MDLEVTSESIQFLDKLSEDTEFIMKDKQFKELLQYPRHHYTNTYDHSVRVAVGAALIAQKIGADPVSAARVGLLHDMCFVNYYERSEHPGFYCFYHPVEAADNADKRFGLTEIEKKAIRAHMFPLAIRIPTSKVALCLTLSDKAVAIYEGLYGFRMARRAMLWLYLKKMFPAVVAMAG